MRFLQRLWPAGDFLIAPCFAGIAECFAGPSAHKDLNAFVKARLRSITVKSMLHVILGHAAAQADVQAAAGENIQHGAFFSEPHGIVERQHTDQIAEPQPLGAPRQRGDHQIGRRQHAVVGVMMLGEPGFVELEFLRQLDLFEQLVEGLLLGHPRAGLIVTERAESHRLSSMLIES